jgi:hypothetical protein
MIAFFQQGHKGSEYGTHAGGSSKSGFGAFVGSDAVGELFDTGIAETAVNIIVCFVSKGSPHFFCIVKTETTGEEQGGRMFHFIGLIRARADNLCNWMLIHAIDCLMNEVVYFRPAGY